MDKAQTGKYDDVLRPFLALMETELHANAGKGDRPGWLSMSRQTALLEIYYHVSKLQKAVKDDAADKIREHAADVANMSMMLLDVCGGLDVQPQPPSASGERELPPLPSPDLLMPWKVNAPDGSAHSSGFTGDQMQAYARAALAPSPGIDAAEHKPVYTIEVRGYSHEWKPTAQAFKLPDGTYDLYAAPPAAQPDAAWLAEMERLVDEHAAAIATAAKYCGTPYQTAKDVTRAALLAHLKARP